ncbi:uncharacterized protein LOC116520820 isoform X3 [Thamnophis elegans]|uniref:uncharacterized protein LOC116520820 isoform X3 n=1 Tax=Thamnophis elegans TaxID=35005 RepID=UPI001376D7BB|nr:uncharacterized protein LOC116520820 isoform X3 [Thamnophis elegans]
MVAHGLMNTRVGGDGQSRNPSPRPSSKSPSPFSAAPRLEKCGGWASPWPWPPSCRGSWGSTASAAQGRTGSARLRTPPLPGTRPSPQRRSTGPVTHQRRGPRPVVERRTAPPGAPVRKTTWDAKFATAGWATILHPVFGCMPVKVFPARLTVCNLEPPESSSLRVACQIRHLFQCILGHLEGYLDSPVHALKRVDGASREDEKDLGDYPGFLDWKTGREWGWFCVSGAGHRVPALPACMAVAVSTCGLACRSYSPVQPSHKPKVVDSCCCPPSYGSLMVFRPASA